MPVQTARAPTADAPMLLSETIGSIRALTLNRPEAEQPVGRPDR